MIINNTQIRNKKLTFHISTLEPTGSQEPVCMLNKKMKGGIL